MITDHPVGLEWHAIHKPCLVEVKMALDETGRNELAAGIVLRALRSEAGLDRDDEAVPYPDIDRWFTCFLDALTDTARPVRAAPFRRSATRSTLSSGLTNRFGTAAAQSS